jgi:hypothetical protein
MIYLNQAIQTTISNAVGDGANVTYTTTQTHNYQVGMYVTVSGIDPSGYNTANSQITAITTNTFNVASAFTGSYVSGGTARARAVTNPDLGFAGGYNDGTYHHAGLFRDASDGIWKFFYNYQPEPDASPYIDTANATFRIASLTANLITDVITLRGHDPLDYANNIFIATNTAFAYANSAGVYANASFIVANTATERANAGFIVANATSIVANTSTERANGAFITANASFIYANTGLAYANSANNYANSAFIYANTGLDYANSANNYANASFIVANTATERANAAFIQANTPSHVANSAASYANSSFAVSNSAASYANAGFAVANSGSSYANSAFLQANTPTYVANSASVYANSAFLQANTPTYVANSASVYANSAFTKANNALANTSGTVFDGELLIGSGGKLTVLTIGGDEGGEILLGKPTTNTTLSGTGVTIDVYQNRLRFFEQGGSARGAYIDLTSTSGGVGTDLLAGTGAGSAGPYANAAFAVANSASSYANSGFAVANSGSSYANSAFAVANSSSSYANSAFLQANTPSHVANSASVYANSAYTRANNSINANTGGTITGDLVVTGNLTITGQTTYANTQTVLIADNIITLNAAIDQASAPVSNAGIEVDRGSSANVSILWNETTDKWTFTNDGTNYFDLGSGDASAGVYANAAFIQANTPSYVANSASVYANAAYAAANAGGSSITITDDNSTNATRYIVFEDVETGTVSSLNVASTKLTFNPSTGLLTTVDLNTSSDERKKTNIQNIENPINIIQQLRGVSFSWKETNKKSYGLIAQELEKILPELVGTDDDGYKNVSYLPLIAFLIETVKDQEERIRQLENK